MKKQKTYVVLSQILEIKWTVTESDSLLDFLTENCTKIAGGFEIEYFTDSTPQGSQFMNGFGGLGAMLRFVYRGQAEDEEQEQQDQDHNGKFEMK